MATDKIHKDIVLAVSLATSVNSPSSLRRKSLHVQNAASPTLSENNDEAEKLARRREIDASLTFTEHLNATNKRRSLGLGFLAQMSAPEMKDRISECIKLSTENKINMKNAFSLQIIDLMTYMIKKQDANMTNLQIASTSLDVSTKIYGFRVDGVYTEIMKMAGGLDKQEGGSPSDDANEYRCNEQQNEINGSQQQSKQKKKKNKQKVFSTVESLKGTVEVIKPTLWIMENEDSQTMDALYQVMQSTHADSKYYLQLYSGVTVDTVTHKTNGHSTEVTIPRIEKFSDQEICPPLANFHFQDWSSDVEEENNTPPEESNENKFQFDLDASLPSDNEDETVQNDINYFNIQDEEENEDRYVGEQKPVERIIDLCKVVSNVGLNKTSEYSFLQRNTNVHWAGPTHWRISNFSKLGGSKIIGTCQQEHGRQRREIELTYDDSKRGTVLAKFAPGKGVKLEASKLDWHEDIVTLPRDMQYNIINATKLYHHKLIDIFTEKKDLNATHVSDIANDYDYNNDNDTSNYCPNVLNEDYGTNDENNENESNFPTAETAIDSHMIFTGDNLVTAPKLTNKISIAYSTRAKRIDMRQLKKSIWKSLVLNANSENTNTQNIQHQEDENKIKENKCFSEIYKTLPNMLTKTNIEALSFPISFVSLLHLANERTLNILSLSDMSDLIIKAD